VAILLNDGIFYFGAKIAYHIRGVIATFLLAEMLIFQGSYALHQLLSFSYSPPFAVLW